MLLEIEKHVIDILKKCATLLELAYELADEMVVVPTWPVEKPSTKLLQSFRSVASESFEVAVAIQQNQRTPRAERAYAGGFACV